MNSLLSVEDNKGISSSEPNGESPYSDNKDTTSIPENPKNGGKFSLITPEMDATYLEAVERGDMATAQRIKCVAN
jgi:hypothetical protein